MMNVLNTAALAIGWCTLGAIALGGVMALVDVASRGFPSGVFRISVCDDETCPCGLYDRNNKECDKK